MKKEQIKIFDVVAKYSIISWITGLVLYGIFNINLFEILNYNETIIRVIITLGIASLLYSLFLRNLIKE